MVPALPFSNKMPPTKDYNTKNPYFRSFSSNDTSMSARVYHQATNLMPLSPPLSPTGMPPSFPNRPNNGPSWSRQNSQGGGKYGS